MKRRRAALPAMLVVFVATFFLHNPLTVAQCDVYKLTAPDPEPHAGFGGPVSISDTVIVVGAPGESGAAADREGAAHVFRLNGSQWQHEQELAASDARRDDSFGSKVAVSGPVIVASANSHCPAGDRCGAVYVFRYDGSAWVQEQKLIASDAQPHGGFGSAVALSGDVIAISAATSPCATGEVCGAVYAFRFTGTSWIEEQKITAPAPTASQAFGASVALSGDALLIGAPGETCSPFLHCGAAHVYRFDGAAWLHEQKLSVYTGGSYDGFGGPSSLSADRAILGTGGEDCRAGWGCGSAYVFRFDGIEWHEEQKLTAHDEVPYQKPDLFGFSVSMSGDALLIGAVSDDTAKIPNSGSAYLFGLDGTCWVQGEKLAAPDVSSGAQFGYAVSLSGPRALIGAPGVPCASGDACGAAYVFACSVALAPSEDCDGNGIEDACDIRDGTSQDTDRNEIPDDCEAGACCDAITGVCDDAVAIASCVGKQASGYANRACADLEPPCNEHFLGRCRVHEDAKVAASDGAWEDGLGYSISISENAMIAGAPGNNCGAGLNCGAAYVYRKSGAKWTQEAKLTDSDGIANSAFGASVAVGGDVAVAGASHAGSGGVYVYRFNGTNWFQETTLLPSDAEPADSFGYSVAVNGNVVIVGAPGDDCGPTTESGCGAAYVYRFNGTSWIEEEKLTGSDASEGDILGYSVAISGEFVVVGAPFDNCAAGPRCGSAYVFRFNGNSWMQEAKLAAPDASHEDLFGVSVAAAGDVVIVGVALSDCAAGSSCGAAYVYRFNGGTWVYEDKLTPLDAAVYDYFGISVSMNSDIAVVGAMEDDCTDGLQCGSAYVFRFNGARWVQQTKLTASDAAGEDRLGGAVSLSGNVAAIGAYYNDCPAGVLCGSAYVFTVDGLPAPVDCNDNALADECDIRDGASLDTNGDGTPDECQSGACCDGSTGVCVDAVPPSQCVGDQARWTADIPCSNLDPPCAEHTGACCDLVHGACIDSQAASACSFANQRWVKGVGCGEIGCEALTGACCTHDPFHACVDDASQPECGCPTCEWTEGASCDDVECARESIPSVGGWGLAILSLLLLTGAKIRFGRAV
jgi:hypothetical protein